jgi:AraC family transcriptional regulator, melibiose operon regulatory protein
VLQSLKNIPDSHMNTLPDLVEQAISIGLASWYGPPDPMLIAHAHNDLELNYLEQGAVVYGFGGERVELHAGDVCLFWAVRPHQLWVESSASLMYWVTLPLGLFLRWQLPQQLTRALLDGQAITCRPFANQSYYPLLFQHWAADLTSKTRERQAIVCLELEAFLRRLALVLPANDQRPEPGSTNQGSHAEKIARFIAAHYAQSLNIDTIADSVGLHPHYAMQLFRKAYGLSIIAYLTQYRVAHAQQLLVTTSLSVLEVGMQAGFSSASRFYSAFKAACGLAPAAYRAALQGAVLQPHATPEIE